MLSPQSRKSFRRTLLACGALFAVLFTLLAAQMVLGRDPAVGEGSRATQTASTPPAGSGARDDGSWVDVALGVVQALASDDDEHGDEDSGSSAAPLQSRSS